MGEYLIQATDLEWRDAADSTSIDCMADYGAFTLAVLLDGEVRVVGPAVDGEPWRGRVQVAVSREYKGRDDNDIGTLRQAAVLLARDAIGRLIKAAPHGDLASMLKAEGVAVVDCRDLERLENGWTQLQSMYEGEDGPNVAELKKQLAEAQKQVADLKSRVELNNLSSHDAWKLRDGVKDALRHVGGRQSEYVNDAELLARAVTAGESHALLLGLLGDLGIKVEHPGSGDAKAGAMPPPGPIEFPLPPPGSVGSVAEGVSKAKAAIMAGRVERNRVLDELHRLGDESSSRAALAELDAELGAASAAIAEHVSIRNALAGALASLAAGLVVKPFELTANTCHGAECK